MTPPPRNRRRQHPANRRRPRASSTHTAARRHSRWLAQQLQTAGSWLRTLPTRLRSAADTAVNGKLLESWSEPEPTPPADPLTRSSELYADLDRGPQIVLGDAPDADERPAAPRRAPTRSAAPRPSRAAPALARASALGQQLAPRALALGRQLGPRAATLGRQLGSQIGPLARRGAVATGHGLLAGGRRLADLRPLLRLLGRCFAAIGGVTLHVLAGLARGSTLAGDRIAGALQRHQSALFALLVRLLWWGALALLLVGGQSLVEIHDHAPFVQRALPVFLTGLGLCSFLLLFARQARIRWAAFALGLGHGGALALVWVVSAAA